MYSIQFLSKRVHKEILGLKAAEQEQLRQVLDELQVNPRPIQHQYSSVLRCTEVKRIKVKRLRVFYQIDEQYQVIHIGKVDLRDSHVYGHDVKQWFQSR